MLSLSVLITQCSNKLCIILATREPGTKKIYLEKTSSHSWCLLLRFSQAMVFSVHKGPVLITWNVLFVNCFAVSEVHGRTFGVWTLLTCTLCFLCAFNLENKPLYLATFLSFIYALGHFLTEYLFYQTMTIANLSTVGFFAGITCGNGHHSFLYWISWSRLHSSREWSIYCVFFNRHIDCLDALGVEFPWTTTLQILLILVRIPCY